MTCGEYLAELFHLYIYQFWRIFLYDGKKNRLVHTISILPCNSGIVQVSYLSFKFAFVYLCCPLAFLFLFIYDFQRIELLVPEQNISF